MRVTPDVLRHVLVGNLSQDMWLCEMQSIAQRYLLCNAELHNYTAPEYRYPLLSLLPLSDGTPDRALHVLVLLESISADS